MRVRTLVGGPRIDLPMDYFSRSNFSTKLEFLEKKKITTKTTEHRESHQRYREVCAALARVRFSDDRENTKETIPGAEKVYIYTGGSRR